MKSIQTGDQGLVKKINKSIVLDAIEKEGPISRAQISKQTSLNKATVSTMVSELINESFVYEIGPGQSSGGRKPIMLYFNNNAGYSIGIDLGVNYILAILTDLKGSIIEEINESLYKKDEASVLKQISHIISTLISRAPSSPHGIIGIGIGIPGIVDGKERILFSPNLGWSQVSLKNVLEDKFNIPVSIVNEANAGAHGEHLYGVGKNVNNLVYISVGIGIGTGIIINNDLYTGSTGISGEMGHFTIETNGEVCSCGNRGCWELYASESVLLKEVEILNLFKSRKEINIENIISEARNGNQDVLQILSKIGEYIGTGLTNVINTFNPEMVIIGNRLALFENWLINPINRVLKERLSAFHQESTIVTFSEMGNYSCVLGASSFTTSKFFSDQRISIN